MAQYQVGSVDVTNGSSTVTGTDTSFLAEVSAGDIFLRYGDPASYTIASVDSDNQITLNAPYAGTTDTKVLYAISRDFTPNRGYPYLNPGDLGTAEVLKEALRKIDEDIQSLMP